MDSNQVKRIKLTDFVAIFDISPTATQAVGP